MYSRSFVQPPEEAVGEQHQQPHRRARPVGPRQRREEPPPLPLEPKQAGRNKRRPALQEPEPPPLPQETPPAPPQQPRGGRRRRRPAPPPVPVPEPKAAPTPSRRTSGLMDSLMGMLQSISTQDLLLIGLIFLLTMEEADDDIILILIALLFISSGEQ